MRTIFVNPRKRPKRKSAKRKSAKRKSTKRKTIRRSTRRAKTRNARKASKHMIVNPHGRKRRVSRRKNASITPFVKSSNPMLRNSSIRRRRKNPGLNLSIKSILDKGLSYGGGSALGAGVNIIGLSKIENKWFRNGARLATAIVGGSFLKGDLGAAMAGATLYPMWQEVALMLSLIEGQRPFMPYPSGGAAKETSASLDLLSADLQDILDEAAVMESAYDNYN